MRSIKIFIIILNWNGKNDTLECLSSLANVTFPDFQPLVVDNGSTDESVAAIRASFPEVPILETGENLGFAGGNNRGIEWALSKGAEWVLLLNNDTVVASDFLAKFLQVARQQPKAKILGAKIYRYTDKSTIDHLGGFWNPRIGEFESPAQNRVDDGVSFEEMEQVDYVCGAALLMHRSVPETIGLLESRFFLFWEETDYCCRARRSGFEVWTAPQAKIWHKVSSSFIGGKPHMHYFWWRSRLLWIERNCPFADRKRLYAEIIYPELWKHLRHFALKTLQRFLTRNSAAKQKARRYQAGLVGAFHYLLGRFGNCPKWLLK